MINCLDFSATTIAGERPSVDNLISHVINRLFFDTGETRLKSVSLLVDQA